MIKEKSKGQENHKGIQYDPSTNTYCLIPNELQELYEEYEKLQNLINQTLDYSKEQIKQLSLNK